MTDQIIASVVAILTAIIGLAVLAVLVSRQSNTTGVVGSIARGFAEDIGAATAPVTGASGFGNGLTSSFGSGY